MRKTLYIRAIALLACLLVMGPAYAFKETPVENVAAPAPAATIGETSKVEILPGSVTLSGKEAEAIETGKGVELRIPGIGSLGTLPRLDFGLELLYGATDQQILLQESTPEEPDPAEDITIRGTLKHRF